MSANRHFEFYSLWSLLSSLLTVFFQFLMCVRGYKYRRY